MTHSILDILRGLPVERQLADGATVWLRPLSFGQLIALEAEPDSNMRVALAVGWSVWDSSDGSVVFDGLQPDEILSEISMPMALELMPMITAISSPPSGDEAPLSPPSDDTPENGE